MIFQMFGTSKYPIFVLPWQLMSDITWWFGVRYKTGVFLKKILNVHKEFFFDVLPISRKLPGGASISGSTHVNTEEGSLI